MIWIQNWLKHKLVTAILNVLCQRTLTEGEVSQYDWPPDYFVWIQLLCLCLVNYRFTSLVKSKPVKQEVSCTVILPPPGDCSLNMHSNFSKGDQHSGRRSVFELDVVSSKLGRPLLSRMFRIENGILFSLPDHVGHGRRRRDGRHRDLLRLRQKVWGKIVKKIK